jgi:hypothetical protein
LDVLVYVATSGFYLERLTDGALIDTIVLEVERLVFFVAALLDA